MLIRPSTVEDAGAIDALYPLAFPGEDLVPLVHELLRERSATLSLVAAIDEHIVGHVMFTHCSVGGFDGIALLGPLAVTPSRQKQGIGSALVSDGLQRLREAGAKLVCVLGDPAYYGRLGFQQEGHVQPPYILPAEWASAWQSQSLDDTAALAGKLIVPAPWQHPELWSD